MGAVEFHFDFGSPNASLAHLVVPGERPNLHRACPFQKIVWPSKSPVLEGSVLNQYDRSIHGVFLLSLELFVNLISPRATKVAYGRSAVPRQSHLSRPECPEFADRRPGRACLTRGNFGGSHTPGNRICQLQRNEAKIAATIAFAHKAATARA
jgi:hypothetical protein